MWQLLWICALIASSGAAETNTQSRIHDGNPAGLMEYPYQAAIMFFGGVYSAATILSPTWALTACSNVYGEEIRWLELEVGIINLGVPGPRHNFKTVICHPDYNSNASVISNDIALIEVMEQFVFNENVQPVTLAEQGQITDTGTRGFAVGWGETQEGEGELYNRLLEVEMEVMDQQQCTELYQTLCSEGFVCTILPTMMCASKRDNMGQGTCKGDEGGPFIVDDVQVGIISFGVLCGHPLYPSVFTRVADYRDWIRDHTGV